MTHSFVDSFRSNQGIINFGIASFWLLIYVCSYIPRLLPHKRLRLSDVHDASWCSVNGISSTNFTGQKLAIETSVDDTLSNFTHNYHFIILTIAYPLAYILGNAMYLHDRPDPYTDRGPWSYIEVGGYILGHYIFMLVVLCRFRVGATLHTIQYTICLSARETKFWFILATLIFAGHVAFFCFYHSGTNQYAPLWVDPIHPNDTINLWIWTAVNILMTIGLVVRCSFQMYRFHIDAVKINMLAAATHDVSLDWNQRDFLHLVLQFIWLCGLAMFVTTIQLIVWTVTVSAESDLEFVWSVTYSVQLFINMLCIWLTFPSSKWRYKWICVCYMCCDGWCERLCLYFVARSDAIGLSPSVSWKHAPSILKQDTQTTLGLGLVSPPDLIHLASHQDINHYERMEPYTPMTPKRSH